MMQLDEQQIKKILLDNQKPSDKIDKARAYTKDLRALVDGKDFRELLTRIEGIEGEKKALARFQYSRSIKDMFERVSRLTDNIYSSTGGSKRYELSDAQQEELTKTVGNVRGGQSLEDWLEYNWLHLYHTDPNGIIFLEYAEGVNPYPTYKSVDSIRNYLPNGQKVYWILFEPKELDDGKKIWRLVDGVYDYTIIQNGEAFNVVDELTFEHEFGYVPAVINSNLNEIGDEFTRLSPYDKILEIAKEFLRDGSIKTIYKFLQGFPKHWRYTAPCSDCQGTGKIGEDICRSCNGTGESHKNDVTDEIRLAIPEEGETVLAPNIAGWVSPDLETWQRFNDELKLLEDLITLTHWGTIINTEAIATATEVVLDTQPAIKRLNKYSKVAQGVESCFTEYIANHIFTEKAKDEKIASISYGTNFILETVSAVLERYQSSKTAGDNVTILDRQYNEYLMTKYKSDPVGLSIAQLKSKVEPYLHYTVEQVQESVSKEEAQKKILFDDFWKTIFNFDQSPESLQAQFETWFEANKPNKEETTTTATTTTAEGTTTNETTVSE